MINMVNDLLFISCDDYITRTALYFIFTAVKSKMKQEEATSQHQDIETPITRKDLQNKRLRGFKSCSLVLKIIALLAIVSIVVMFCYLPTLLHNKEEKESIQDNTDPTHAQLPHIDAFANES
ncbi:hypothetical protein K501DRAFT_266078 [Backusella circina FSU 941]|nr:hypothetical protein K501DRAFT_266078 [Backusella circina FSU 941]